MPVSLVRAWCRGSARSASMPRALSRGQGRGTGRRQRYRWDTGGFRGARHRSPDRAQELRSGSARSPSRPEAAGRCRHRHPPAISGSRRQDRMSSMPGIFPACGPRLVAQGANIPCTQEAEQALHKRGVLVLPDFIAKWNIRVGPRKRHSNTSMNASVRTPGRSSKRPCARTYTRARPR